MLRRARPVLALRLQMAAWAVLVMAGCQASTFPPAGLPTPIPTAPVATASPSPMPSPACDPIDELLANMFVGLSEAALSNARIEPEEFFAALAGNRETLERYLETLGIPFDDALIDAAMSANLGQRLLRQGLDECPAR